MPDLILNPSSWYLGATAAFLILGIYVLIAGGASLLRNHFLVLACAGLLWGVYFSGTITGAAPASPATAGYLVEILFLAAWFALLYRLLRGPYRQSLPETVRRALLFFWGLLAIASGVAIWLAYGAIDPGWTRGYFSLSAFSAALLCFALSAQLGRDAPVEDRVALRAFTAAAGIFAGAQAVFLGVVLLSRTVPSGLASIRAAVAIISAVLILIALRKNPQWSLAIFVSPQARAYAPRLLSMIGMLLVMLAVLPFFRSLQPGMASPLALLFMVITGLPVAALLFSEILSARLRVFVSKHFLPFRYDYREEWLRLIDTLASPDEQLPLPDRAIKAVAQIVGSPAGVLWMRRGEKGPFICRENWNTRMWSDAQVSFDDPVVKFMHERHWILDTSELARDPELYGGLERPAWLERFPDALLIVPLISSETLIGFIVLFQSSSAFRLTFEEIDLLRTSGRQVAAHLAQYEADQQLAEAKQFEAFNRLTAFVMHDLKNLIAQQSLMVKNAAKHKNNPAFFQDAIATIENSVARMNNLLRQLQSGEATSPRQQVRLTNALGAAIDKCMGREPRPVLSADSDSLLAIIDRERFVSVIAHLIRNAQEATTPDGSVTVQLAHENSNAIIGIEDDGSGMGPEFIRNRLFRPFDSTKGSKGMGIGAYQARTFVTESGGTMDVRSELGRGTRITIRLPLVLSQGSIDGVLAS